MGVVSAKTELAMQHATPTAVGHHRCWYAVCISTDLKDGAVLGRDFLSSRIAVWRNQAGKAVVQTAWCPHLGADLSVGQIVDGRLRCPYHHWSFEDGGACVNIPTGDKIPAAARIFSYPTKEAWGLVWAFNGETPDFDVPSIPDADESSISFAPLERLRSAFEPWLATSNGVDFQHLRTLHGLPVVSLPEELDVEPGGIGFRIESPFHLQHGRISGTNSFSQHLRIGGKDMFMLFSGTPVDAGWSVGHFVVGVPKGQEARLPEVQAMMLRLSDEDRPVLTTMRFRRGLLTASDRHLARYFKYAEEFPSFLPPS
jgi:phenylpropionate dioxygenase-like ring-hydroxylating dioxygenase large terminal subunit